MEFEHLLALAVLQRDRYTGVTTLNPDRGFADGDARSIVESLVGADIIVKPGSTVEPVGRPIEEFYHHLSEDSDG